MSNGQYAPPPPQQQYAGGDDDFFDWEGTPDEGTVPDGNYNLHIERMEDEMSSGEGFKADGTPKVAKRMISASFQVDEPANFAGMFINENFVVGTDESPTKVVPGSLGTRRFKALMKACAIPAAQNIKQLIDNAVGTKAKFAATVVEKEEQSGEYKGTKRNNVTSFKKLGEMQPQVKGAQQRAAAPQQYAAPPQQPQYAQPAPPQQPPQPADPMPVQKVAPQYAASNQQQAPQANPAPPQTAETPIPCTLCAAVGKQTMVKPSELPAHIAAEHSG